MSSRGHAKIKLIILSSVSLLSLTTIARLILISNKVSAESPAKSNASVTVPEACTMTSTNDTPHTATLTPNTYSGASGSEYENGIGKTTLTAICNDSNGFAIYAIGYTGNSYDSNDHTKLVGNNTGHIIDTAVYTNNATPSNWSMKVTKVTNSSESYNPQNMSILDSFDSWHIVPASYTKVAQYHASTGSSVTDATLGAKIETTYAAFIAPNQPADTYIGQVKYTMVHPYTEAPLQPQTATSGCINYFPNGSNVEGTMGCQSISDTATSATLLASNFSRTGYGFAGWSNKFDYATNPNQEGIKFYGPQETITFTAGEYTGSNNGLALYAVWVKSQGSIQDSTKVSEVCNRLTTAPTNGTANLSSVSAFTDSRDNNTYAIARLADGKCWMIENLRLEAEDTRTPEKQALAQGYGTSTTYGNFSGLADAESTGFTSTYTANSLYYSGTQEGIASIDIGTSNYPGYRMPRYNNTNTSARASSPTGNGVAMYSYGNYYTWHAAIADTTYNGTNNQSTTNTSLCPTGWHLPIGGRKANVNVSDFWKLSRATIGANPANYAYDYFYYTGAPEGTDASNKLRAYPNNFLCSGAFGTSSAFDRGSNGYYWSSTAYNNDRPYNLGLSSSHVDPGTGNISKYYGGSIRCTVSAGN